MKANISGNRIRAARIMKNPPLLQADLIAKMQIEGIELSKNIMTRIENGKRYVTDIELKAFAKVLEVSTSWLLEETTDSSIKK